jgi:class 3 adenylate cyclase
MAAIIVTQGPEVGEFFPLEDGSNLVGRSPGMEVHLHDMTVSRRHMRISCDMEAGSYTVQDLGSTHGVKVNGIRVREPLKIVEGDTLAVGSLYFMFTARKVTDRSEAMAILQEQESELATLNFTASAVKAMAAGGAEAARQGAERFRNWAGADRTTLAIVFTDMVASTQMTSELGNEAMNRKRRAHFNRVRDLADEHDGYEIKSSGDGFMLAFHAAVKAVDFAEGICRDPGERSLVVRAGVHIGPVVVEDEDVQGAAVSYAARVADMAEDGGLWISAEVKNHLDQEKAESHAGLVFDQRCGIELRGFPGPQDLWVVTRRKEAT